jgi:MOSC domain-containing protein YiiM
MTEFLMHELLATLPQTGHLQWIGLRPARRAPLVMVDAVEALADGGLAGDHRVAAAHGRRQVSLIQAEHLPAIAALCGRTTVPPAWLRRNLVVSGINLLALKDRRFTIGAVTLEGAGPCAPCSRMEEILGPGGYNAMRGHGGIVARVITGGVLRVGDAVAVEPS